MSGPYPPHHATGASGPKFSGPPRDQPPGGYPQDRAGGRFDPGPAAAAYPGTLPPPVQYPRRRRWPVVAAIAVAVAVVAAIVVGLVLVVRDQPAEESAVLTPASAQQAIQTYLDALSDADIQTIAKNTLCGLYDGVKDRRSDDALAKLSAEAFHKQFSKAEVTSVDAMVFASPTAAQALFTMKVVPAGRTGSGAEIERQGVAQMLVYNNQVLVCSYVLRTAGTF